MADSQSEVDVWVQRVVKDITNAFKRNPNIDEIGVIPCPVGRYNRSPIVMVENKLGVESWCVKFLLPYVQNKLLFYRQRKHRLDKEALVDITSTLLLLNPDFTTAWNVRKELIQGGVLHAEKDLYLGKLALTKFPKSPETWIHRRWVLQQILTLLSAADCGGKQSRGGAEQADVERSQQSSYQLAQMLQQELNVCSHAACSYPSNYNAWSHRIWVLQHMAKGNVKVFHDELATTCQWVSMHVSDHSGFHYRQFLLKELIEEFSPTPASSRKCSPQRQSRTAPNNRLLRSINVLANGEQLGKETTDEDKELELAKLFELFHQEMELCSDLIRSFPGHETLWSHRRHVFYLWHQWRWEHQLYNLNSNGDTLLHNNGDTAQLKPGAQSCEDWGGRTMEVDGIALPRDSKRLKRGLRLSSLPSLSSECTFLSDILDSQCNPEQRHFGLAYKKWLDSVIGKEL